MWRRDGLCRIQAERGHDALCQVCREYPRLYMDYGDFAQWGIELSCPEAARLIFQGIQVRQEEIPGGETPEYDGDIMKLLEKSREEILTFWDSADDIPSALTVTLLFAHQTQAALDGGVYEPLCPESCLQAARQIAGEGNLSLIVDFFQNLEILTDCWKARLSTPAGGAWDKKLRFFAIYLIRRYWFQAV